ncbi:MAG: 4-hydroxy-tetrahydrodipicolinate synthase [Clostridia bacterium]|nr:4-hydroxy-tetrahydrodipicolinate synthase [Clostridia bacterium]
MKECIFRGVGTALITPFRDGKVDEEAFGRLIDFQIENGVAALIVAGTTGESSVLNGEEYQRVMDYAVEKVNGRVPVIIGTGSNDTAKAIEKTKAACAAGADAVLLVTPYYNKTTQRGLAAHYRAIADASGKPCILYNVPSRTGLNMQPETVAALAEHPMIAGLKEASGSISQAAQVRRLCGDRITLYSGCDDQTVPFLSLGGMGVISVASNVLPREMSEICRLWFAGEPEAAMEMHLRLLDVMNALMSETNPIPVKAACARMGYGKNEVRLPLVPMEEEKTARLMQMIEEARVQ